MQKLASKTRSGEKKNMMNDANQKDEPPESEDLKNLDALGKAFIVQMAWSYVVLRRGIRAHKTKTR